MNQNNLILSLFFLVISSASASSQSSFTTRTYQFPEYGFSIPFYEKAQRSVQNSGKTNEYVEYVLEDQRNGFFKGALRIYPGYGCVLNDSLYAQVRRYALDSGGLPHPFRLMHERGFTYSFSWSYYEADATIDTEISGQKFYRNLQAYSDGRLLVIIDIIFTDRSGFQVNSDAILKEPGFTPILMPATLDKIGLKLKVRGNIHFAYEEGQKTYFMMRCDRFNTPYPHVSWREEDAAPAVMAMQANVTARGSGASDLSIETLPADDKLSKFTGSVYRVSYELEEGSGDQALKGRIIEYYFTCNNLHYSAKLAVPFIKDDKLLYWYQEQNITAEDVAGFESKLLEILGTVEGVR